MNTLAGINYLYAVYPILAALLLIGAGKPGKADSKEGFLSISQTKAMCGFFAICVILHHVSQQTAGYRLFERPDAHGLEPFYYSGYLFVSWFLFCSGFGLTKSYRTKSGYLESFGKKRVMPVVITFILIEFIYLIVRTRTTGAVFPANDYSWYIYTMLVLYGIFYAAFRKLKRGRIACVAVFVLLYCVFCRLFGFGEWWFNSAPVFVLGMLAAVYEERIIKKLEKNYAVSIVCLTLLFALFFAASENTDAIYRLFGGSIPYALFREAKPLLQTAAASFFCAFIAALGMKVRFGGKALAFLGSLTLEIYLIQGIFLNIFGRYLFDGETASPLFIPDGFLYALAVCAASVLSAFLLKKLCSLTADFIGKAEFAKVLWKDAKKAGLVIGIIAVVFTLFTSYNSYSQKSEAEKGLNKYRDENITLTDAEGTGIAAYITGEGDQTVVILRSELDPCPTLSLHPLADALAENYRTVVFDFPGQGFSAEPRTERTADNIAAELHSALHGLGIDGPVIFIANDMSGIYALAYIDKYPGSVSAFIGIDAYVPESTYYLMYNPYSSDEEYTWALHRTAESTALKTKLMKVTGYTRMETSLLETLFTTGTMSKYTNEVSEMYIRGYYNDTYVEEQTLMHSNCLSVRGAVLPEDMPALFLMESYYIHHPIGRNGDTDVMLAELYQGVITNDKIQEIDDMNNYYVKYSNPKAISGRIDEFLSSVSP